MRRFPPLILPLSIALLAYTQTEAQTIPGNRNSGKKIQQYMALHPAQEEGQFIHEFSFGGSLNTNGWDGFLQYGKAKNEKINWMFQLEAGETKDPKEYKNPGTVYPVYNQGIIYTMSARPYIFGKENILYHINLNFGQTWLIGGKANTNGVSVSAVYAVGVTLGLIRPYYLQLYSDSSGTATTYQKFNSGDSASFLNPGFIAGGSGLSRGWNELSIDPGIQGKAALRFDWSKFDNVVSSVEAGVRVQAYTQKVYIMALEPPHQVFLNAYIAVMFGKRW